MRSENQTARMTRVYMAQPIGGVGVPEMHIVADEPVPDTTYAKPEEVRELYVRQAKSLADALFLSLPGGTVDALVAEMLRRKASLLSVRY